MPQIIPIRDLKITNQISDICHSTNEPVFVTKKNGYGDMVIMSMEEHEKMMYMNAIYNKLQDVEQSIADGNVINRIDTIKILTYYIAQCITKENTIFAFPQKDILCKSIINIKFN